MSLRRQPREFRADGWPLCPWCGENEVYSLVALAWFDPGRKPSFEDMASGPFKCYGCSWAVDKLLSRAGAVL